MSDKSKPGNYVFVITESPESDDAVFVGLADENGAPFVPVTEDKEAALMLLGRLAAQGGGKRQVEAIHKVQIAETAREKGFVVFVVDGEGKVRGRLGADGDN